VVNYLIQCSACRDFIRFQNRNKFVMVMRVRYVHTKGLATMIDIDVRGVLMTWSTTVHDNRSKRVRGNALIWAAGHTSALGAIAEQSASLDMIGDGHRVVQDIVMEWSLSSVLLLRREVWWGNVNDMYLSIERWDDARAILWLLATVLVTDRALVSGTIIAQVAIKFTVVTLVVAVHFAENV